MDRRKLLKLIGALPFVPVTALAIQPTDVFLRRTVIDIHPFDVFVMLNDRYRNGITDIILRRNGHMEINDGLYAGVYNQTTTVEPRTATGRAMLAKFGIALHYVSVPAQRRRWSFGFQTTKKGNPIAEESAP